MTVECKCGFSFDDHDQSGGHRILWGNAEARACDKSQMELLRASLLDARERVGQLEQAFDVEREARNRADSMITFAASNLARAEAQLTALRERAEKAERELDAEAARIDALAAHLDVNGSATLTVWANEMIEIEGVCVGDDDDDDDDPAMFDSLREALDYLAENSPHADEGDDDTAPAPAGECDD
jgi:hypothetical protein